LPRVVLLSIALSLLLLPGCLEMTHDSRGNLQSVGLPFVPIWTAPKHELTPRMQELEGNATPDSDWLAALNKWREMAGSRPLGENSDLSYGCQQHAQYLVDQIPPGATDLVTLAMSMGGEVHHESTGRQGYTEEGAQAAIGGRHVEGVLQAADVSWGQSDPKADIDGLLVVPFHRLSLLAPWVKVAGFGRAGTAPRSAAALALRGPKQDEALVGEIAFPPPGSTVPIGSMNNVEWPNPLASCPGYRVPAGLPVTVQLGKGQMAELSSYSFSDMSENRQLQSCAFDNTSYRNSDRGQQAAGINSLRAFGAVVLIPRQPLQPGHTYKVSLNINGAHESWSFSVASNAQTAQATP